MIVDLTGKAITEIRDYPAVAAITARVRSGELDDDDVAPAVVIVSLGIDYSPFGRTRRAKLQAPVFAANCYGLTRPQASQLANAVVEAINLRGPRNDASGRLVFMSLVESSGNVILDPVTTWPFATVIFTLYGVQAAVA